MFPDPVIAAAPRGALFSDRASRVVALGVLIVAMSAMDLVFTLHYAIHTGINESNPIARVMIAHHSPAALAIWKGASVALGVGILVRVRKRTSAELGAWFAFGVLATLMVHWARFVEVHRTLALDPHIVEAVADPTWVRMGEHHAGSGAHAGVVFGPITRAPRDSTHSAAYARP